MMDWFNDIFDMLCEWLTFLLIYICLLEINFVNILCNDTIKSYILKIISHYNEWMYSTHEIHIVMILNTKIRKAMSI